MRVVIKRWNKEVYGEAKLMIHQSVSSIKAFDLQSEEQRLDLSQRVGKLCSPICGCS